MLNTKFLYFIILFSLSLGLFSIRWYLLESETTLSSVVPIPKISKEIPQTAPSKKFDFEVLYTNEGYKPNNLEVQAGSRVQFRNTSSIPMWTASDPHPVHSDFSTFDSQKDYVTDEVYTFTFTTEGTFGYHNHSKSIHRGIVKVTDKDHPTTEIEKTKGNQRAIRDKYLAVLDKNNPDTIFTVLDSIEANNTLSRDCHDMAHDLGHRAYELYGFSTAMTFNNPHRLGHTSVDDICAGGYMHGILEELFLHQPELRENPKDVCSSIPTNNRGSCFHGVGHGVMFANKRDAALSLTTCRKLQYRTDTHRCFEGVWMEFFWGETGHAGANTLGWTLEKPLEACKTAKDDEKPACFLYAHLGYLRTHHKDFQGVVTLCTESGLNKKDKHYCLKGLGITMMKHFTSHRLSESEKLVTTLSPTDKYSYYEGVIGYSRLSSVPEEDLVNFCNQLENDRTICSDALQNTPK